LIFSKCRSLPFIASIALGTAPRPASHYTAASHTCFSSGEIVARCFKHAAHAAFRRAPSGTFPHVAANILNCLFSPSYVPSASQVKNSRGSSASTPSLVSAADFWADLGSRAKAFFRFDLPSHSEVLQSVHAIGLLRNCCVKV
jgi:hypothetical protein